MINYDFYAELFIPSENYLYKPARKGRSTFLYKNPVIKDFQENLKTQLTFPIRKIDFPPVDQVKGIVSCYTFGVTDNFWKKDVTNMVKAPEDAIFSLLPFDDSEVICSMGKKVPSTTNFILISIGLLFEDDSASESFLMLENINRQLISEREYCE